LESARKVFSINGYHDTSMSAIAEKAGVGKGTLYWHFDSKDELFDEMLDIQGKKIIEQVHIICSQDKSPDIILQEFIKSSIEVMDSKKPIARMILNNENYLKIEVKNKLLEIFRGVVVELEEVIKRGIKNGFFRDEPPTDITVAILGAIHSIKTYKFISKNEKPVVELKEFIYKFILEGIEKKEVSED